MSAGESTQDLLQSDDGSSVVSAGGMSRRDPSPTIVKAAHGRLIAAAAAYKAGDTTRAKELCDALIAEHPEYVAALHLAGRIHLAIGEPRMGLEWLGKAAALAPDVSAIRASLDSARAALGIAAEGPVEPGPGDAAAEAAIGVALVAEREFARAAAHLRSAVSRDPSLADAWLGLGRALVQLGDESGAIAALEAHHRLKPDSIASLQILAQMPPASLGIDLDAALTRIAALPDLSADDGTRLAFARASSLDRRGRHTEAWEAAMLANGRVAAGQAAAREAHRRGRQDQVGWVHRFDLHPADRGQGSATSLFILGVSRSGKSTLERLLSCLPRVVPGYENTAIRRAAARASQSAGLLTITAARRLPRQLEAPFAVNYAEEIRRRAGDARVFISTQPGALLEAGALVNALGNVRFVLMRRDPQDIAVRMLFRHYRDRMVFAYDLRAALDEVGDYARLMDTWQSRLPGHCMAMTYEDLVSDPETAVRRVCTHCGIDRGTAPLPAIPDDRSAARPYRDAIAATLAREDVPPLP